MQEPHARDWSLLHRSASTRPRSPPRQRDSLLPSPTPPPTPTLSKIQDKSLSGIIFQSNSNPDPSWPSPGIVSAGSARSSNNILSMDGAVDLQSCIRCQTIPILSFFVGLWPCGLWRGKTRFRFPFSLSPHLPSCYINPSHDLIPSSSLPFLLFICSFSPINTFDPSNSTRLWLI